MSLPVPLKSEWRGVLNAFSVDDDGNPTVDGIAVRTGTKAALDALVLKDGELALDTGRALRFGDGTSDGGLNYWGSSGCFIAPEAKTPALSATAFRTAYAAAAASTPGGSAISATNRATVVALPGVTYDFSGSGNFDLSTAYVDIVGLGGRAGAPVIITDSSNRWRASTTRHLKNLTFKSSNNNAPIQFTAVAALTDAIHEDLYFDVATSEIANSFLLSADSVSTFTARRCRTPGRRLYGGSNSVTFDNTCKFVDCEGGEGSFGGGTSTSAASCAATWLNCILRATSGQTNNLKFAGLMIGCNLTDSVLLLTSAAKFYRNNFDPASGAALLNGGSSVTVTGYGNYSSGSLAGTNVTVTGSGNIETLGAGFIAAI